MRRVAFAAPCIVAMDVDAVLSSGVIARTRVATYAHRRDVRACSASTVTDPSAYIFGDPDRVSMMGCIFEW